MAGSPCAPSLLVISPSPQYDATPAATRTAKRPKLLCSSVTCAALGVKVDCSSRNHSSSGPGRTEATISCSSTSRPALLIQPARVAMIASSLPSV